MDFIIIGKITSLESAVWTLHLELFCFIDHHRLTLGFPGGSVVKSPWANSGDPGSVPGSGRSPEERNGNPLQYSCLGNTMNRGAWQVAVHEIAESDMTEQLAL